MAIDDNNCNVENGIPSGTVASSPKIQALGVYSPRIAAEKTSKTAQHHEKDPGMAKKKKKKSTLWGICVGEKCQSMGMGEQELYALGKCNKCYQVERLRGMDKDDRKAQRPSDEVYRRYRQNLVPIVSSIQKKPEQAKIHIENIDSLLPYHKSITDTVLSAIGFYAAVRNKRNKKHMETIMREHGDDLTGAISMAIKCYAKTIESTSGDRITRPKKKKFRK